MSVHKMKDPLFTKETWFFIALTILCVWIIFAFVDLKPQVDYDVFFSREDPTYKADVKITESFPRSDSQIIVSVAGDIHSPAYKKKIKQFGDLMANLEGVSTVKSIMHGPQSVHDAVESPFWRRLLISDAGRSSNLIVMAEYGLDKFSQLIPKIENLKDIFEAEDFSINISGYPFIVDLIRRHLSRDLRIFTALSFVVFGIVVVMIFHSWRIFIGMMVACFDAAALTLIITELLSVKIGILTANISTIVFVLTLSHIVFLTFNWKHLYPAMDKKKASHDAIKITLPASFWAMFTTLLGFLSLLSVQAKPIRELGVAGAIGTCMAILMAYCVFPSFLRLQLPPHKTTDEQTSSVYKRLFDVFYKNRKVSVAIIIVFIVLTSPQIRSLNTDPSLLSFFSPQSPITQGLKYIDKHGGSNPLVLVVTDKHRQELYKKEPMEKLWNLQEDLEAHENVGTVLSMPLLLAEAKRSSFFSFLIPNKSLLKIMNQPRYGHISRSFVSEDYKRTLFLLRMKEEGRQKHRLTIIDELKNIVQQNQLIPALTGSIYALQGNLSHHVAISLVYGLARLITVFAIIAFIASRHIRTAFAMTFSVCLIPLGILGFLGTFRIPLDIIAAPAANIAISMGIDAMIHMVHTYRRLCKESPTIDNKWFVVRQKLWEPIITSMFIVACGFGIFFFSSFPPTQRFGGSIVLGTILAAGCAMWVFPALAHKKPPREKKDAKKASGRLDEILSGSPPADSDSHLN